MKVQDDDHLCSSQEYAQPFEDPENIKIWNPSMNIICVVRASVKLRNLRSHVSYCVTALTSLQLVSFSVLSENEVSFRLAPQNGYL